MTIEKCTSNTLPYSLISSDDVNNIASLKKRTIGVATTNTLQDCFKEKTKLFIFFRRSYRVCLLSSFTI